jgi:nicotinate-nucleotide adenylyltransferase
MRIGVFGGTFDPVHVGHLAIAQAALEGAKLDQATKHEPRFTVSRVELDREGPSYTVDTLEALKGDGELFLIVGSDALAELPRWRSPERIRALARILVARRPGAPEPDAASASAFDAPCLDISSRELRARRARGLSLRYLVPDDVWRHIERRALYR